MEYYNSKAFSKVCEIVYETDLTQMGTMTKPQLELMLEKSVFDESQRVLDVGCGVGRIADYLSKRTLASFLCVDLDEGAIAKGISICKENPKISFKIHDLRDIAGLNQTFTKILVIDSLYFVADIDPKNLDESVKAYTEAVKSTIKDLYSLLEKNGELIIFWSELPFFKLEKKSPECTQVGVSLTQLGYSYVSYDLTDLDTKHWKDRKRALLMYEQDFIEEGSKELFDSYLGETNFFLEGAEKGRTYRNMYIVKKGKKQR
jgi:cyclopropane fatty-acyl-phospholipid synthase-like methyltransferase